MLALHESCLWLIILPLTTVMSALYQRHRQQTKSPAVHVLSCGLTGCLLVCAAGITGGFAGGERGVRQFVEKGELELAAPGKGESQHWLLLPLQPWPTCITTFACLLVHPPIGREQESQQRVMCMVTLVNPACLC